MSFWSKIGTEIKNLEMFKAACEQHEVKYEDVSAKGMMRNGLKVQAILTDTKGKGYSNNAFLVQEKDSESFKMEIDNDIHYSTLSARLGANGGKLVRDYTRQVVELGIKRNGGCINFVTEQPDGSLLMKVSRMG